VGNYSPPFIFIAVHLALLLRTVFCFYRFFSTSPLKENRPFTHAKIGANISKNAAQFVCGNMLAMPLRKKNTVGIS
jgi:hypothetical protein